MKKSELRIDGIYDLLGLRHALALGANAIGFDIRPTSLNFCQQHILLELVKELPIDIKIFLIFQGDPDFVIQQIYMEVKEAAGVKNSNLFCEFSCLRKIETYESFKVNYIIRANSETDFTKLKSTQYLKGISFYHDFLEQCKSKPTYQTIIKEIYTLKNHNSFLLSIIHDTGHLASFSHLELIPVDFMAIMLDASVEFSYRKLDTNKMTEIVSKVKNSLTSSMRR